MTKQTTVLFEDYDPSNLNEWDDVLPYEFVIKESAGNDETTCPASFDEIYDYLKTEDGLTRKVKLTFVRTAEMNGIVYWLWKFRSGGDPFYLTVVREPNGRTVLGSDDAYNYTPEQYLVCDYYVNCDYPSPSTSWEEFQKERDAKAKKQALLEEKEEEKRLHEEDAKRKILAKWLDGCELSEWKLSFVKPEYLSSKVDVLSLPATFSETEIENEDKLAPGALWTFNVGGVAVKFHWCPPGQFMMGRPPEEPYPGDELDLTWLKLYKDELYHPVILTKGFWITEVPVTQELYSLIMGYNPSECQGPRRPAGNVSWVMAQVFLEEITKLAPKGRVFQLPTEAQWEYACRAGTTTRYNLGDELKGGDASNFSRKALPEVGLGRPNLWGIYDMHGLIEEWCSDWYRKKYLLSKKDPIGPKDPPAKYPTKVLRGGYYLSSPASCRSCARESNSPTIDWPEFGFRFIMARTADKD